ncbi:MAG: tyrosine-type recombinase/integrase [Desulfomonile tiedjei]|uniref:Tyrosine-type recombinase/integrase n=1 Tax=Desulfomonile tiedjei TaxID=2358 RepID=A0A9D6V1R8_9BACT|nr:tyrosine-type recombinase/integrase [Desulfomonile tiedjei]
MAVKKRGKVYYLRIRPFDGKLMNVRTMAQSKVEATKIERAVLTGFGSGDYRGLDPASREVCVRIFKNQGWEMPPDLCDEHVAKDELTLWRAIGLCLKYPEVKNSPNRQRHEYSFARLVEKWSKDLPVKKIWIPEIREYQIDRLNEGAAPSTINKEKAALSKLFQVLIELRYVDLNPARLVKNLSEMESARQAYISFADFQRILDCLPAWFPPIAQTAYYTGMRRGEVVGLTHDKVNLRKGMIYLGPEDVKERNWKRVPIHEDLVPVLDEVMKVRALGTDRIFLHNGEAVNHRDELRWCWDRKVIKLDLNPFPHFHDLRHTWKTNARRSGMDPEIREAIMGHWYRGKTINERYGRIGDQELIDAIDGMSFEHGDTEIFVNSRKEKSQGGRPSGCDQIVTQKRSRAN